MEITNIDLDQMSVVSGTTDGSVVECMTGRDSPVLPYLCGAERVSPVIPCQDFNLQVIRHYQEKSSQDPGLTTGTNILKDKSSRDSDRLPEVIHLQEGEHTDCCKRDIETACRRASLYEHPSSLVHINKTTVLDEAPTGDSHAALDDSQRDLFESQGLFESVDTQVSMTSPLLFDEDNKIKATDIHPCCSDQLSTADTVVSSSNKQTNSVVQQGVSSTDLQLKISDRGNNSSCSQNSIVSEQKVSSSDLLMKVSGESSSHVKEVTKQGTSSSDLQMKVSCESSSHLKEVTKQGTSSSDLQIQDLSVQQEGSSLNIQVQNVSGQQQTSSSNIQIKDILGHQKTSSFNLQINDTSLEQRSSSSDRQIKDICHQKINSCDELLNLTACSPFDKTAPKQLKHSPFPEKEELNQTVASTVVVETDSCSTASHSTLPPQESLQHSFQGKEYKPPCTSLVSQRKDTEKTETDKTRVETADLEASSQESKASSLLLNCPSLEGSVKAAEVGKMRSRGRPTGVTAGMKTSRVSSRKRRTQSEQASDVQQLPQRRMLKVAAGVLGKGLLVESGLPGDSIRYKDNHLSPGSNKEIAADAKTQVCENGLAVMVPLQSSDQPKIYSKELQRLLELYDKMLDKLNKGCVVNGKSQLQKFEQIMYKLKVTHESYRARLLAPSSRQGVAWQRRWQLMLDNQAMLAVAWNKHQLLEQRIRTDQGVGPFDRSEGVSQRGLEATTTIEHPCSQQSGSSRDLGSSARHCGTVWYGNGEVSAQQGVGLSPTMTARDSTGDNRSGHVEVQSREAHVESYNFRHAGLQQSGIGVSHVESNSDRHAGVQKSGVGRTHVEGNSSRSAGIERNEGSAAHMESNHRRRARTQRCGGTKSCMLPMNSETAHPASADGVCSLPQTSAYQEETRLQYSHEASSLETQQLVAHIRETANSQAGAHDGSDSGRNVAISNSGAQNRSDSDRNVAISNNESEDVISVHDDSDIDERAIKAAGKMTNESHSTVETRMQNYSDECNVRADKRTESQEANKNDSAIASGERCVESCGGKHLLHQDSKIKSAHCLSGHVPVISGQSASEMKGAVPFQQDQLLPSETFLKEGKITSPVPTSCKTATDMADGTCLQKVTLQSQAKQLNFCLAEIDISDTDKVHHVHGVRSLSHGSKNPSSLGVVSHAVVKNTFENITGTMAGGVRAQSTIDRLHVPGQIPSSCLSDQAYSQTGDSVADHTVEAIGDTQIYMPQNVDKTSALRQLANTVSGSRLMVLDDRDVATVPNGGHTFVVKAKITTGELADIVTENRFQVPDERDTKSVADFSPTYEVQATLATGDLADNASENKLQVYDDRNKTTNADVGSQHGVPAEHATGKQSSCLAEIGLTGVGETVSTADGVAYCVDSHVWTPRAKIPPAVANTGEGTGGGAPQNSYIVSCTNTTPTAQGICQISKSQIRLAAVGTRDVKYGISPRGFRFEVPGTAVSKHRASVVPGATDSKCSLLIEPATTNSDHRVPVLPNIYSEHGASMVHGTTDSNHRGTIILATTDSNHRVSKVSGTADSNHRLPIAPGTTDSRRSVPIVPWAVDSNHIISVLPSTVDFNHKFPKVPGTADSNHETLVLPGKLGSGCFNTTIDEVTLPEASQTSQQKLPNQESSFSSNIRSKPISPASTASSSLFVVASKKVARTLDKKVPEKLSLKSQSHITQTPKTVIHYLTSSTAKPRTLSVFGLQSVNATNLATDTNSINQTAVNFASTPKQAISRDKQLASNLATSLCQTQAASYSKNQFPGGETVNSNCRKRGRQKKNGPADNKGKKSRSGKLTSTLHQGQMQHYFPLKFITSECGSVGNSCKDPVSVPSSCTENRSVNSLPTSQSKSFVSCNAATPMESIIEAPEPYARANKAARPSTCEQSSKKSNKDVDVPLLIRNLRSVLLIADEEVTGTSKDFPAGFWDEDFTRIRMSESVWKSLDDW